MNDVLIIPVCFVRWGIALASVVALVLGFLSAFRPTGSIGLYVWMMSKFNWRVGPIDEVREIQNTRRFGIYLILLSTATIIAIIWGAAGV